MAIGIGPNIKAPICTDILFFKPLLYEGKKTQKSLQYDLFCSIGKAEGANIYRLLFGSALKNIPSLFLVYIVSIAMILDLGTSISRLSLV
tara:strand:+ start:169 stop:438 length:270 start_codon:yes stop_codon:yes gene_type:complete